VASCRNLLHFLVLDFKISLIWASVLWVVVVLKDTEETGWKWDPRFIIGAFIVAFCLCFLFRLLVWLLHLFTKRRTWRAAICGEFSREDYLAFRRQVSDDIHGRSRRQ